MNRLCLDLSVFVLLLGVLSLAAHAVETTPHTTFQTPTPYLPENDIRTGAVIVYSDQKDAIQSWIQHGFVAQTMYGFRTGDAYIKDHRDEVQTTRDGTLLTCGPGSYYMVPTATRIDAAVQYFTNAIQAGALAVIPEEPEFFSQAGYSESFKKAWQDYYHEPWQDQTSSVTTRFKSDRLKAKMEYDMVAAILNSAASQNPTVRRMVACHSPVNYFNWGIVYPHYQCLTLPNLQEIVGQVWTGTARSSCVYEGVSAERTFENAFLEYSSLYNLVRGTGKRTWFLMDPLEDNPDRSMEDYNSNYIKTLVASLLFPEVDSYEVMPWPTRIFGRVPDSFATQIGSIVMALEDMHNHQSSRATLDAGTSGIATLVADSMGWQRGDPSRSSFDSFYGLTLPLIYDGVPVQVAQLERTPDKDYLKPYKVLLVSYDILKPMKPEYNQAIADWVKQGGCLVFFGGTDAYNAVPEWWGELGFASPQADLYERLIPKHRLKSLEFAGDTSSVSDHAIVPTRRSKLFSKNLQTLSVPAKFPLTLINSTEDASCKVKGQDGAVISDYSVNKGSLIHVGIAPAYFASSKEAANALRSVVAEACTKAKIPYESRKWIGIKRGPYNAIRTFDGARRLKGSYIDLLYPTLPVAKNPTVQPQQCAFFYEIKTTGKTPHLLYSSSKLESKSELSDTTLLKLSGTLKTKGVARVFTVGRSVSSITPASVKAERTDDTLLLTYDNNPDSIDVCINWK